MTEKNTQGVKKTFGLLEYSKLIISFMRIRLTLFDWIDKKERSKKIGKVLMDNPGLQRLSINVNPINLSLNIQQCSTTVAFQLNLAKWDEYVDVWNGKTFYQPTNCYGREDSNIVKFTRLGYSLDFAGSKFCRCKVCAVCMWRRSRKYRAKIYNIIPHLHKEYFSKGYRAIFLTFTIKNIPITDLDRAMTLLNEAWKYLYHSSSKNKKGLIPIKGFIKSLEITRNSETDEAHPHLHVLALVDEEYFQRDSETYLTQPEWIKLWRQALDSVINKQLKKLINTDSLAPKTKKFLENQRGYDPSVRVKAVDSGDELLAIPELTKYMSKEEDLYQDGLEVISQETGKVYTKSDDGSWLVTYLDQTYKRRAISLGGLFKHDPVLEELPKIEDDDLEEVISGDLGDEIDLDIEDVSREDFANCPIYLSWENNKYKFAKTGFDELDNFLGLFELDINEIKKFEDNEQ